MKVTVRTITQTTQASGVTGTHYQQNGLLHRETGPAVFLPDGWVDIYGGGTPLIVATVEWWTEGEMIRDDWWMYGAAGWVIQTPCSG